MKLNKWEAKFWAAWNAANLVPGNDLVPRFAVKLEIEGEMLDREFDFGSAGSRLLIECDGLGGFDARSKRERCGGHQTARGMRADSLKRNAAILDGWRVLVFPSSRLDSAARMAQAIEETAIAMTGARRDVM